MASFDFPGLPRIKARLARLGNPDANPLMDQWRQIIVEGNRRGVLSGVDGFDKPMPPLKYRMGKGKRTANRRVPLFGKTVAPFVGRGDNLSAAEYQKLTGPRLAPRKESSRSIKNLRTETRHTSGSRVWEAVGFWDQFESKDGFPILLAHFESRRPWLPRYDLRPIRPRDLKFCVNAFQAWAKQLLRVS